MSCDKLVFDLSQEIEGSPNVFIKKDWLNILDNMNQNYSSNQSVVDTSQLSNSNKYISYREGYLMIPLLLTLSTPRGATASFAPNTAGTSSDYALGLKNWFGSVIHSFTLDYNGTTIIQQTPYINMWNAFKLMTSLSWNDVITQGSTIGFYPDDPLSWGYVANTSASGQGVVNNQNAPANVPASSITSVFNRYNSGNGNVGLLKRQQYINFDPYATAGDTQYLTLFPINACNNLWKSYIFNKQNTTAANDGIIEIAVMSTVYLKHIHSFFQMIPLLKGVFMKMTMNLLNTSVTFTSTGSNAPSIVPTAFTLTSVSVPVGGICPLMIASGSTNNGGVNISSLTDGTAATYTATLSVGGKAINSAVSSLNTYSASQLAQSIYLYVPAYTFNPAFEEAYLASPVKQIKYTDVYQYQVLNVTANSGQFNNLLTNGIANVKSILILPYYSATGGSTGLPIAGVPVFQSPFDPAGSCCTSPLCLLTNFNVVVSGQNAIYNTERYSFEQFNNQLYGQNAVNGGMTDGLTSCLINSLGFEMEYCYYYVNISRMLPVEESVPKSIQIIGTNNTGKNLDLWCFIEYGVEVSVDIMTGARI